MLFHLSPAILPSTNAREVYFVNHKIPLTVFRRDWCDYFLFPMPGKKDYITIDPEILWPYFTLSQVTKQYGAYTVSPAMKTTSAIIEVNIDKWLHFQVNRWNIA